MTYSKDTMWIDHNQFGFDRPITCDEVEEYYISDDETFCEVNVKELWDKVVMSDEIPSRYDVQMFEYWLGAAQLEGIC